MIELLLQAERALSVGLVDQADALYRQAVAADPRNSIAVVGLARVALERADDAEAYRQAQRALGIDPENIAAQRLVERLAEILAYRGEALPGAGEDPAAPASTPMSVPTPEPAEPARPDAPAAPAPAPAQGAPVPPGPRRGIVDRLLRRNRS